MRYRMTAVLIALASVLAFGPAAHAEYSSITVEATGSAVVRMPDARPAPAVAPEVRIVTPTDASVVSASSKITPVKSDGFTNAATTLRTSPLASVVALLMLIAAARPRRLWRWLTA